MKTTIAQTITFGRKGDARDYQAYGWSVPEDGFTWTDGPTAGLILPVPSAPHGFFLEFYFWVNGGPKHIDTQRVIVSVNGRQVGQATAAGRMRLAFRAPPVKLPAGRLIVNLDLPDAAKPTYGNDSRTLGLAMISLRIMPLAEAVTHVRPRTSSLPPAPDKATAIELAERITGLSVSDLAMRIESLGKNCEPGFFQRKCGAEPISLLRFSGLYLFCLVTSIDDGFPGLGDTARIDPVPDEADLKDWIIYERRHMLRYHTWVGIKDATAEDMRAREAKRLPFLRRKLLEDLENGEKIFVHLHNREMPDEEIWPLFLAIRRRGPGALLCICAADETHPPGHVEEIVPGLMRTYFSHFSSAGIGRELSMPEWLAACTNAWLLTRQSVPASKAAQVPRTAAAIPPRQRPTPEPHPTLADVVVDARETVDVSGD